MYVRRTKRVVVQLRMRHVALGSGSRALPERMSCYTLEWMRCLGFRVCRHSRMK